MRTDQESFILLLDDLHQSISGLLQYKDLGEVASAADAVNSLSEQISQAQADARLYNGREAWTVSSVIYIYIAASFLLSFRKPSTLFSLYKIVQALFGLPVTDYSRIKKLGEEFEPYNQLWKTASSWGTWENDWMQSPLEELDPNFVESSVQSSVKSLYKIAKIFTQRGFDEGADCAKKLQTSFEAFQEYLPLIQVSPSIPAFPDFSITIMTLT